MCLQDFQNDVLLVDHHETPKGDGWSSHAENQHVLLLQTWMDSCRSACHPAGRVWRSHTAPFKDQVVVSVFQKWEDEFDGLAQASQNQDWKEPCQCCCSEGTHRHRQISVHCCFDDSDGSETNHCVPDSAQGPSSYLEVCQATSQFPYPKAHSAEIPTQLTSVNRSPSLLRKIVTMDEAWCYQYDPETKREASQWLAAGNPRPSHPRRSISVKKVMLVAFFDFKGVIHFEFIRGGTVDTATFIQILGRFKESLRHRRPHQIKYLHMDNAPAHGSRDTRLHLLMTGQRVIDHPPPSHLTYHLVISGSSTGLRHHSEAGNFHPWMLCRPQSLHR